MCVLGTELQQKIMRMYVPLFISFRHIFVSGTSGGISTALRMSLPVPDVQFRKEAGCLDSKFEELNAGVYGYTTLVTF